MGPRDRKNKEAYARPDHHDPTARFAGAPSAWVAGAAVLAVVASADLIVVARRKVRGEPG